jgi:hypothetical protein
MSTLAAIGDNLRIVDFWLGLIAIESSWLEWNGGTAAKIATCIGADHSYRNLPILADALEEAGCANHYILDHCRLCGEHVRGCWLVDLLLGKQ